MKKPSKKLSKIAFKIQKLAGGKRIEWEVCALGYGLRGEINKEQSERLPEVTND